MEASIGAFINHFIHNLLLMCVSNVVFVKMAQMSYNAFLRWGPEARDEIYMALVLMPIAEANIRAPASAQLSSTDATVQKSGSCVAEVTDSIVRWLYAKNEREVNRFDWISLSLSSGGFQQQRAQQNPMLMS